VVPVPVVPVPYVDPLPEEFPAIVELPVVPDVEPVPVLPYVELLPDVPFMVEPPVLVVPVVVPVVVPLFVVPDVVSVATPVVAPLVPPPGGVVAVPDMPAESIPPLLPLVPVDAQATGKINNAARPAGANTRFHCHTVLFMNQVSFCDEVADAATANTSPGFCAQRNGPRKGRGHRSINIPREPVSTGNPRGSNPLIRQRRAGRVLDDDDDGGCHSKCCREGSG
jgi:hypothetical protein